jgi:predicted  nucleic acid-binding Zn-ribbon protein
MLMDAMKEYEHRLTETEERSKSNQHRIDELVKTQEGIMKRQDTLDELVGTVKVLADREARVENDVNEIKSDVKSLTLKPAKRWDGVIDKLITATVAGMIGYILSQIGF